MAGSICFAICRALASFPSNALRPRRRAFSPSERSPDGANIAPLRHVAPKNRVPQKIELQSDYRTSMARPRDALYAPAFADLRHA